MELKPAIHKETGDLVMVRYIDRHPAEGSRYEIVASHCVPSDGALIYGHELSFDPFDISEAANDTT